MAFVQVVSLLLLVATVEAGLQVAASAAATPPAELRQHQEAAGAATLCAHGECIFSGAAVGEPQLPPMQQVGAALPALPASLPAAGAAGADPRELTYPVPSSEVLLRQPLQHTHADCFQPCGGMPGFCPSFCGAGNACCRYSGDDVVPDECKAPISPYRSWHYECVQAKPDLSLGSFENAAASGQTAQLAGGTIGIVAFIAAAAVLIGLAAQYRLARYQVVQERCDATRSYSQLGLYKSSSADLESTDASQASHAAPTILNPAAGYLQSAHPVFAHSPALAPTLLRSMPADVSGGK